MTSPPSSPPSSKTPFDPIFDALFDIAGLIAKALWSERAVLTPLGLLAAAYYGLSRVVGYIGAGVLAALLVAGILWWGTTRRPLIKAIRHGQFRHLWVEAQKAVRFPTVRGTALPPLGAKKIRITPYGTGFSLRVAGGLSIFDIEDALPALAAQLHAHDMTVEPDEAGRGRVHVTLIRSNPFATRVSLPRAIGECEETSLWEPVGLGRYEDGAPASITLPGHHLLIGGESGGGKSVALNGILAHAALDPSVALVLMDAKKVELALWARCADEFVSTSIDEAIAVLTRLCGVMDTRHDFLVANARRKIGPGDGLGLTLVVIDELAMYMRHPDKKKAEAFATVLRQVVSLGRAAGVIVVAATQKPSADVIDTTVRDLFSYRLSFRCTTTDASDTILGRGWASKGYSASDIDSRVRGVGLLIAESARPRRLRTAMVEDAQAVAVAAAAAAKRQHRAGIHG